VNIKLTGLKTKYIVNILSSWIVDKQMYIKMEYCSQTLKDVIAMKAPVFKRSLDELMDCIEFYISCQIFKEILECVQYLHEIPIIHRDLKPENILISNNIKNNRYIKLGDFGLYTRHEKYYMIQNDLANCNDSSNTTSEYFQSQTHSTGVGTLKYMAPEVRIIRKYTTKADIYSLGVIAYHLFDIDIDE
jgi:serine/threonine protein kinase